MRVREMIKMMKDQKRPSSLKNYGEHSLGLNSTITEKTKCDDMNFESSRLKIDEGLDPDNSQTSISPKDSLSIIDLKKFGENNFELPSLKKHKFCISLYRGKLYTQRSS